MDTKGTYFLASIQSSAVCSVSTTTETLQDQVTACRLEGFGLQHPPASIEISTVEPCSKLCVYRLTVPNKAAETQ